MNDQKTVAKTTPKSTIRDILQGDEFKRQVAKALPRTISPDRFIRIALTATFRTPKLLDCSRESLLQCLMDLSAMGLEPDGRRAHLIPYRNKKTGELICTLIIDYKGIAELVRRHGDVAHIHCDVVGENDAFEYRFGTGGLLEHKPAINDRGPIYCAYSYVRLKDGSEEFDIMGVEEVEQIRKRSKSADDGPWVSDWNEMAKKTIFRRHSKTLPLSPELRDAIERDDDREPLTENERFTAARPATASVASSNRPSLATLAKRSREQARIESNLENHDQAAEDSAPSLPSSSFPEAPDERTTEEVADVPSAPVTAPQPPSLADKVGELLTSEGYSVAELLAVLRDVRFRGCANAESLEQCPPDAMTTVLADWENCKRRLDSKRVPA
jgi:recombination protein RecT